MCEPFVHALPCRFVSYVVFVMLVVHSVGVCVVWVRPVQFVWEFCRSRGSFIGLVGVLETAWEFYRPYGNSMDW